MSCIFSHRQMHQITNLSSHRAIHQRPHQLPLICLCCCCMSTPLVIPPTAAAELQVKKRRKETDLNTVGMGAIAKPIILPVSSVSHTDTTKSQIPSHTRNANTSRTSSHCTRTEPTKPQLARQRSISGISTDSRRRLTPAAIIEGLVTVGRAVDAPFWWL